MADARMRSVSKTNQWHFIHLVAMLHDGFLAQEFKSETAKDKAIAKNLGISRKTCSHLKIKLLRAKLVNDQWMPLGEGELWMTCSHHFKDAVDNANGREDV